MIEISVTEVWGFNGAIRGMRNPHESWEKSDSHYNPDGTFTIGQEDRRLMKTLAKSGPDHGKFMRDIHVQCDILAPLYWWKEMDTYKVGTTANSCSTMHKIAAHEFTRDMFSVERLDAYKDLEMGDPDMYITIDDGNIYSPRGLFKITLEMLNRARELYLESNDKKYWWQMIQLLPSTYNQLRTWDTNYAVLKNIYHARKNHKLDEWHVFCDWIKTLPVADIIIET